MHFSAITLLAVAAAALPQGSQVSGVPALRPWKPADPTDSRSPCPLLNTLANHGYLYEFSLSDSRERCKLTVDSGRPHDGRNITAQDFGNAIHDAINFDISFGLGQANLQLSIIGKQVVDLEDLNAHELVEHRASLTRDDASSGDSIHLDPSRLTALLADSDTTYLDISSLAKSRVRVEALSGAPPLPANQVQQAAGEVGLIMLAMADGEIPVPPSSGTLDYSNVRAPKDRLNAWLTDERLPVEFGWKPAPRQYLLTDLSGLTQAVLAARSALEAV
jgi:hypothetical protein